MKSTFLSLSMRMLQVQFAVLLCSQSALADAKNPCNEMLFENGTLKVGRLFPISAGLDPATIDCLHSIGQRFKAMRSVRSVTVVVRLPASQRVGGAGLKIVESYKKELIAGGVSAARVSGVAPAAARGEAGVVTIVYTEKKTVRPVFMVEQFSGDVKGGRDPSDLKAVTIGAMYPAQTYIHTGASSAVALALADGSRLRLSSPSQLLVGSITLNAQLEREVSIRLLQGKIESHASPAGKGSRFDLHTPSGVAGVRGTSFRVALGENEETRLETLLGSVELANEHGAVLVHAGYASVVERSGAPSEPKKLLEPVDIESPLEGNFKDSVTLNWESNRSAKHYLLELARDAEFTLEVREMDVSENSFVVNKENFLGKWFWRVRAVDGKSFGGLPSKIYAFILE
jgi:hypothetical protein